MFFPLKDRALIGVSGEDAPIFLQGLITNDIENVTAEKPIYAALLTPQGKYLFDFIIFKKNETYYLDCETSRSEDLYKKLKLYKLRSKVTLEIKTDLIGGVYWGDSYVPKNAEVYGDDPRHQDLGHRFWIPKDAFPTDLGPEVEEADYRRLFLMNLIPYGSADLEVDRSVILEYGLNDLGALSWTKGCYVGQELMARTHHRGLVRKGLYLACLTSGQVACGHEITYQGEKLGVARAPVVLKDKTYALVLLRRDLVESLNLESTELVGPEGTLMIVSRRDTI